MYASLVDWAHNSFTMQLELSSLPTTLEILTLSGRMVLLQGKTYCHLIEKLSPLSWCVYACVSVYMCKRICMCVSCVCVSVNMCEFGVNVFFGESPSC